MWGVSEDSLDVVEERVRESRCLDVLLVQSYLVMERAHSLITPFVLAGLVEHTTACFNRDLWDCMRDLPVKGLRVFFHCQHSPTAQQKPFSSSPADNYCQ